MQLAMLNITCAVFSAQLAVADFDEMYVQQRPIPVGELHTQSGAGALLRDEGRALADI